MAVHAQTGVIGQGTGVDDFRSISSFTSGTWLRSTASASKVKGSPYLFDDWNTTAIIISKDKKKYKLPGINYDAKLDQIVAKISSDSLFSFNPQGIEQVLINKRSFKRYLDPELGRNCFYEVIASGDDFELLKRNTKAIKEGVFNPLTQTKQTPDTYILSKKYFVRRNDLLEELPLKKNKVMKVFADKSDRVKQYVREHKLSLTDDADLQKIFIYYDSI